MKKEKRNIIYWALMGFVLFIIGMLMVVKYIEVVETGIEISEISECKTWKKWSTQPQKRPGFYLLEWQKAQCDHYNIEINAPVR